MLINFNLLYRRSVAYSAKRLLNLFGSSSAPGIGNKTTKHLQPLGIHPTHPRYLRQMFYQNFYSIQDGTLIWQKFPMDEVFFKTTTLFLILSLAYAVYRMSSISFSKKKKD